MKRKPLLSLICMVATSLLIYSISMSVSMMLQWKSWCKNVHMTLHMFTLQICPRSDCTRPFFSVISIFDDSLNSTNQTLSYAAWSHVHIWCFLKAASARTLTSHLVFYIIEVRHRSRACAAGSFWCHVCCSGFGVTSGPWPVHAGVWSHHVWATMWTTT